LPNEADFLEPLIQVDHDDRAAAARGPSSDDISPYVRGGVD
jgi:hypothetical protein